NNLYISSVAPTFEPYAGGMIVPMFPIGYYKMSDSKKYISTENYKLIEYITWHYVAVNLDRRQYNDDLWKNSKEKEYEKVFLLKCD
ncbi:MAG: hypothetical protein HYZ42_04345, partial [Bacteroidetes bacterium]|nr:hypothetical protein [Bacteroidota bacterium]